MVGTSVTFSIAIEGSFPLPRYTAPSALEGTSSPGIKKLCLLYRAAHARTELDQFPAASVVIWIPSEDNTGQRRMQETSLHTYCPFGTRQYLACQWSGTKGVQSLRERPAAIPAIYPAQMQTWRFDAAILGKFRRLRFRRTVNISERLRMGKSFMIRT